MPYIKQEDRSKFKEVLKKLPYFENPGEVNYFITKILLKYENQFPTSYKVYNEIIGVLECCKHEFYSKNIRPYEEYKCEVNGEVYAKN
jgi:hypothetical protein